ncbi:MAG: permease prefix domain 2-containing transporter, partial [Acidobacteriota bacterium]
MTRLPRFAAWLLSRMAHPRDREAMLGDLLEEYARYSLPNQGFLRARCWFWWQVATTLRCDLAERVRLRKNLQALLSQFHQQRRGDSKMQNFWQDFRFALRTLTRSPGFTALVVLTLALGIGANTTVFSLVDSLIIHPFDYPEEDRLIGVGTVFPKKNQELGFWEILSPLEYMDVRTQSKTPQKVVCWDMGHRQVSGAESPENVFTAFWWGNALDTLGVQP